MTKSLLLYLVGITDFILMKNRFYKGDLHRRNWQLHDYHHEINRIGLYSDNADNSILNSKFNKLNEYNCELTNLNKEEMEEWGSFPIDFMLE